MEKAVIVSAFMLVLAIVYVYIIEPLLKQSIDMIEQKLLNT